MSKDVCSICGAAFPPVPAGGGAAGYAVTPDKKKICYKCADARELEAMRTMKEGGKLYAYVSSDGKNITTWTGGVLARVVSYTEQRGNFGGKIARVRAVDASGRAWYGSGAGKGMSIGLRRAKKNPLDPQTKIYRSRQLEGLEPLDRYGASVKISTTRGSTNFLGLDKRGYGKVKRALLNPASGPADETAARELQLFIENDADLYRQQFTPILVNLMRKMKAGKYDHALAPKLWLYLVDSGAKKYVAEFVRSSSPGAPMPRVDSTFNLNTRRLVAQRMADEQYQMMKDGQYSQMFGTVQAKARAARVIRGAGGNPKEEDKHKFFLVDGKSQKPGPFGIIEGYWYGCKCHSYGSVQHTIEAAKKQYAEHVASEIERAKQISIDAAIKQRASPPKNPFTRVKYPARSARLFRAKSTGQWGGLRRKNPQNLNEYNKGKRDGLLGKGARSSNGSYLEGHDAGYREYLRRKKNPVYKTISVWKKIEPNKWKVTFGDAVFLVEKGRGVYHVWYTKPDGNQTRRFAHSIDNVKQLIETGYFRAKGGPKINPLEITVRDKDSGHIQKAKIPTAAELANTIRTPIKWSGKTLTHLHALNPFRPNPRDRSEMPRLYASTHSITMRKGKDSAYPGQNFEHTFSKKNPVAHFGLPRGTVVTLPSGKMLRLTTRSVALTGKKDIWGLYRA